MVCLLQRPPVSGLLPCLSFWGHLASLSTLCSIAFLSKEEHCPAARILALRLSCRLSTATHFASPSWRLWMILSPALTVNNCELVPFHLEPTPPLQIIKKRNLNGLVYKSHLLWEIILKTVRTQNPQMLFPQDSLKLWHDGGGWMRYCSVSVRCLFLATWWLMRVLAWGNCSVMCIKKNKQIVIYSKGKEGHFPH